MRIAILDPAAGISGDMTLGALVAVGLDPSWIETLPRRVRLPGVRARVGSVDRCGVRAMKVDFVMPEQGHPDLAGRGRTIGELKELVRRADVSVTVREKALEAFELLGAAEGRVHGMAPDAVHLHEVGAVDAVLDIVGAVEGFERLDVAAVHHLPVGWGDGWVDAHHGALPVPAPATAELLKGMAVRTGGPVTGEAVTPTGAALLRVLSAGPPPDGWRPVAYGWGAGTRDEPGYPNALRLVVAETADEAGIVDVIATDIDDLAPEYLEPLRAALLAAGALDCVAWPTQGKKGRVSVRLEALAPPGATEPVIAALFANSTTAGVRRWRVSRHTLARRELTVELASAVRVRIKVWDGPSGLRLKSEYDDVVAAAGMLGRPALEVAREAERRAHALLELEERTAQSVNKE